MATAQALTRDAWDVRAIALAEAKGARGTARYLRPHPSARGHVYRVPSRSGDGTYAVVAWGDGRTECTCPAGQHGRPCCHAGDVLLAERVRLTPSTGPSDAWAWWMLGGEW